MPRVMENTGAIVAPSDPRNFKVKEVERFLPMAVPEEIPDVYLPWDKVNKLRVLDQARQPACVGHAGAWLKTYLDLFDAGQAVTASPRFLYTLCKDRDGIFNADGTYPKLMCDILRKDGVCDDAILTNNTALPRNDYIDVTKISDEMYENAEPKMIKAYFQINNVAFENLKREIYRNKAILVLFEIGKEWWTDESGNTTWDEDKILPLRPPALIKTGHEVVCWGYDKEHIWFVNSFGREWGQNGHGYFKRDYLPQVREVLATVDLPNEVIEPLLKKRRTLLFRLFVALKRLRDKLQEEIKRSAKSPAKYMALGMDKDITVRKEKRPVWLSSADPEQLSRTVKGVITAVGPLVIWVARLQGFDLGESQLLDFGDLVVNFVAAVGLAVGAAMTLFGALRKVYYAVFRK